MISRVEFGTSTLTNLLLSSTLDGLGARKRILGRHLGVHLASRTLLGRAAASVYSQGVAVPMGIMPPLRTPWVDVFFSERSNTGIERDF